MNSDPAATVQYRLDLVRALHSVSPALAALHASRAAALHPEISAVLHSHCPKCGTYRFSGDNPSNLVGPSTSKKRRHATPKTLQRRCHLCGFSTDVRTSPSPDHSREPPSNHTTAPPVQTALPRPQSQVKPTLKDMLSRDRQREKSQKRENEGHEGLTAFLKQL